MYNNIYAKILKTYIQTYTTTKYVSIWIWFELHLDRIYEIDTQF